MKILMIATSADRLGQSGHATGVWLEELTTPFYAFRDAGADVTLASIAGGAVPVDTRSVKEAGQNEASVDRYLADPTLRQTVAETPKFTTIDAAGFDAVFLPGGHGTMTDYPENPDLARLIELFDRSGRIVSAVCHGPAGLLSARKPDGTPFVAGRRVSAFADSEERAVGLEHTVPFLLEDRLRALGAIYEKGPDFASFATQDGTLLTGQNPASAARVAALVVERLKV
ncbi:MAG: type 1 glutamine amidotransferase domain-containing protein [Acetobacter fabarum]|jgi:putative intracellular protease/amidase|uniref:type 1 glutamine amidotransferase domain-containing protein n=1 Tax=Acetobacter fabarum TaxID=483199 RepID=UPI00242BEAD3|nr:type 1 glutamine amidotransferase domain-containing protein [Acetobacter fabarum]MCH4024715.1 type 1 glutamine amidotransferase domain-containing protein [Acetobacter fabarum]MCH4084843.1 type 1 glutamine amidotransferase domain-containing protein [Acetobacter fabarum]MCH4137914.1 type 1 glutamine amidotransferase domain-containing protein [Acetobacter fabarum]